MTQTGSGVYGGVSASTRQAERRSRLMAAGLALGGGQGWANTTVRGVCREAGLSSRFFYESFDDLDALAVALFDELVDEAMGAAYTAIAEAGVALEGRARAAFGALVEEFTRDPRRARFLFMEALGSEPLMRRRLAIMRSSADLLAAMVRESFAPWPEGDTYIDVVASVLAGGFIELMISFVGGELKVDKEHLIADFVTMLITSAESAAQIARARVATH